MPSCGSLFIFGFERQSIYMKTFVKYLLIKGRIGLLLCYLSVLHRIANSFVQFIFSFIIPNVESATVAFEKIGTIRLGKIIVAGRDLNNTVTSFIWLCV